jgi:hypothetical protein
MGGWIWSKKNEAFGVFDSSKEHLPRILVEPFAPQPPILRLVVYVAKSKSQLRASREVTENESQSQIELCL